MFARQSNEHTYSTRLESVPSDVPGFNLPWSEGGSGGGGGVGVGGFRGWVAGGGGYGGLQYVTPR